MIDKVLGTFFTRLLSTVLMIVVVVINANAFGSEGTGTIALVVLGLTLLQVLTNFVGGGTLVYLVPRKNIFQLFMLSFLWACIANVGGIFLLKELQLVPAEYTWWLLAMTSVFTIYNIDIAIVQGKENIRLFNILQILQSILLLTTLSVLLFVFQSAKIELYLTAYIFSYLVVTVISFVFVVKQFDEVQFGGVFTLLKEMVKLGFWTQIANLTQLLTYRLNYYFVDHFIGRKSLGVYEMGTKISEAVWIFPKSICLVQYARISNQPDMDYTKNLTLGLLKIVAVFALAAVLVLLLLPAQFLVFVLGADFANSKSVICSLLPGIFALSCTTILAHHFSGYGKYWVNAIGSVISLLVTAVAGILLIPKTMEISSLLALQTAGWITSAAYVANLIFTLTVFVRFTHATARDFLITRADFSLFKQVMETKLKKLKRKEK